MKYFNERLRSLSTGLFALLFLLGISLSACTGTTSHDADDEGTGEETEQVEAGSEHSEGEEHPAGEEHPSGEEEAPTDTTATQPDSTAVQ